MQRASIDRLLARSDEGAAEAARRVIDFVRELDPYVVCSATRSTVTFRSRREFCSLWPLPGHVTLWILDERGLDDPHGRLSGEGRAKQAKLRRASDVDEALLDLLRQAWQAASAAPEPAEPK